MHINIGRILKKNGVKNLEDITLEKDIEDLLEETEDPGLEEEDTVADHLLEESKSLI